MYKFLLLHWKLYKPLRQHKAIALTHKSHAFALAQEVKKSAKMEHKNKALATQIKELKEMLSRGLPFGVEPPPPVDAPIP
jgi:hypothetical protein